MADSNGKAIPFPSVIQQCANDIKGNNLPTHHADNVFDAGTLKEENIVGKKITEARKAVRMLQKDLAAQLKNYNLSVSSGAISKWEKGDSMPNPYQLLAVCHILQINEVIDYFTGTTPEPQDYTPELNQKGLNLLSMFKETLVASGKYTPRSRRSPTETIQENSGKGVQHLCCRRPRKFSRQ
jgi:transcriptional regulator with XRE-family HTH domain